MKKKRWGLLMAVIAVISLLVIGGCNTGQPAVPAAGKEEAGFRGGRMEFSYPEAGWRVSQMPRASEGSLITLYNQDNEALVTMVTYERISARETDLFNTIRERDAELGIKDEKTNQETLEGTKVYTLSYHIEEDGKTRYTYARINRYSDALNIAVLAEYYHEQDLAGIEAILATLKTSKSTKVNDILETLEKDCELGNLLDDFLYTKNGEQERKVKEAYAKADLTFYPEDGYDHICSVEMVSPLGNIHTVLSLGNSDYYEGDYAYYYDNGVSFFAWIEADEIYSQTAAEVVKSSIQADQEYYAENTRDYKNVVVLPLEESDDAVWQVIQVDEVSATTGETETHTAMYYVRKLTDQELLAWELELIPYGFNTTTNEILAEVSKAYGASLEEYGPTAEMLDNSNRPAAYADYGYEYDGEGENVEEIEGYTYIGKTRMADSGWETEMYVPRGYYTSHWDYMIGFDLYGVDGYAYVDSNYYDMNYSEYAYSEALSNAEYHEEYSTYYQNVSDVTLLEYADRKLAVAYFAEDSVDYDESKNPTCQIFICQELSEDYFMIIEIEVNSKYTSKETYQVLREYGELLGVDFGFFSDKAASGGGTGETAALPAESEEGETDGEDPLLSGGGSEEL